MSPLARFGVPGNLTELSVQGLDAWSTRVRDIFQGLIEDFPQLFDPTATDAAADQATQAVTWVAFPAKVAQEATSEEGRWDRADRGRDLQDEYCEWSVARTPDGRIARVTFTSETPEYYEQLMASDPQVLLDLYEQFVGQPVSLDDLGGDDGYNKRNRWNARTDGLIAHLQQRSNTLEAAIILAATATVLRHDAQGRPVINQQALVRCGDLGDPARNSDPQIAAAVNQLARQRFDVSLADPPGLYLDGIVTDAIEKTPDGTDPQTFWTVERGDADHVVRARFEVPDGLGYVVGDLRLAGRPIRFGGQLADRVNVKIAAVAQPGAHQPLSKPCEP